MKKSLIILSGGMDSVTMLYQYQQQISVAITFDYGANMAEREIECAKYHCQKLGIKHIVIDLPFIKQFFNSSLLQGSDKIPNAFDNHSDTASTIVPFRNGIMLAIAVGIANSNGCNVVLIANQVGGTSICRYPDCSLEFMESMQKAVKIGTNNKVKIFAPYSSFPKSVIVQIGEKLGVEYEKTYSCYKGQEKHCGVCGTCVKRKEAFKQAGIEDKTIYEQ